MTFHFDFNVICAFPPQSPDSTPQLFILLKFYIMAERMVGRPWTAREDRLLVNAVAIHGETDNWKAVAQCVPGRTNKACRKASINLIL